MIGNNENCPCGSGVIVGNCCGKTTEPGANQIQIELKDILNSYYETSLEADEVKELESLLVEWNAHLGEWMEEDELVTNVSDYYFFIVRKDLWRRHLVKALNRTQNRAVRNILKSWQNSFITFAEVTAKDGQVYHMKEILGEDEYLLTKEPGEPNDVEVVLAIVLEEWRNDKRYVMPISAVAVNKYLGDELVAFVQGLAEAGQEKNSFDFFKNNLVDIYEFICTVEAQSMTDVVEQNFTPLQLEVVDLLDEKLEDEEVREGAYEVLLSLLAFYFADQQPNFRKPEVVSAAAFQLAVDLEMIVNTYTQAEIAELFGVSTSSYKKHTDVLKEKIEDMGKMINESKPGVAYYVGTDPRPTEHTNWQVHVLSSAQNFTTLEEAQAFMQQAMQKPFEPENQQQEAQMLCYMAYNAETVEQRLDFAEQALGADPTNVDALLLQAEYKSTPEEQEKLLKQAIFSGEMQFDTKAEDAWAYAPNRPYLRSLLRYGVWLREHGRFEEANELFLRLLTLDLFDHQGVRYLAISTLLYQGEMEQAEQILAACAEMSEGNAVYHYMAWVVEMDKTQGESDLSVELFELAEQLNPFVGQLIHTSAEKGSYPRAIDILPGTPVEARYIWYLM